MADHNISWKFEAGIIAAGAVTLAAFLTGVTMLHAEDQPEPVDHFTQSDFQVFDRDFQIDGTLCEVGLADQKICMHKSPLEKDVERGETLPAYIPALGAEFRVIVKTSLKDENLRTVRYGQTLVLLEPETRRVEDVLHLTAPDFVSAQNRPTQPKV